MFPNAALESQALLALLKLDKGLLLVDCLALLLDGLFELGFSISFTFGTIFLAFSFTFDLGCWILRFFGLLLSSALGRDCALLLLLKLTESLRI